MSTSSRSPPCPLDWGPCEYVIVHTILGGSPGHVCPAKGSQHSSWHSCDVQLSSTSACDILQVSWCVLRQPPQLGGSDLAHHQESLAKDWGLVTRWSATDVTCQTIILLGHHCCRYRIWFERLLFVSFHLFEGKNLFASPSVVSEQFSELHRGRHLFPSTSNFKFAAFLSEWTINCLFSLTDARTLSQVLS